MNHLGEQSVRNQLTQREVEILRLMAEGLSNKAIAEQLFIGFETVKWYLKQIYSKLHVSSRTQAIAAARASGLLDGTRAEAESSALSHTLPVQTTPFVGREAELAEIARLLGDPTVRLVTILGSGGIGKTRLASALITHELERARAGEWLPHAQRARQKTVDDALAQLERQHERLLDVYLSGIIARTEFERKHHELSSQQESLRQQQRQLDAQARQHLDVVKLTDSITAFCTRLQTSLDRLDFTRQRQLVELLVDCVIVSDEQVEIRYVIPTGPQGETTIFGSA
jgi:DNA-binding CsgD family transcriptional regulator